MTKTSSQASRPATAEVETAFHTSVTSRGSLFACLAVGASAVLLIAIGALGPAVVRPVGNDVNSRSGPLLTESAELELRAVAEARALAAIARRPVLTESAVMKLRAVAEARALAAGGHRH